jgi:hypothetical protein
MRIFYTLWSLLFLSSFPLVVQNQDFFGEPVVTAFDLHTSRSFVYHRQLKDDLLSFRAAGNSNLIDLQTGSLWNIMYGRGISGTHEGKNLLPAKITAERIFPYYGVSAFPVPWLAIWQRFDANWYLAIAQNGYGSTSGDVHFPPLYPVLIRFVSLVFGNDFLSALFISQISLYLMVKLLYDLFAEWGGERLAEKALFFLLIFPTSFFFFSAYTEATFIIFAILSLQALRNQKWTWAGFWIFCAILVRLQGIALILPVAWSFLRTRFKDIRLTDLFLSAFSPLVAAGIYLLIRARSGDPSVLPFTETNLHARIVPPWANVRYSIEYLLNGSGGYIDALNLAAFILFSVLIIVHWKRFPVEYNVFSLASMVLLTMRLVDTQPLNSMIRYVLTVFPVFYLFGSFAYHKWLNLLIFSFFLSLNLFLSAQFFLWGWVG